MSAAGRMDLIGLKHVLLLSDNDDQTLYSAAIAQQTVPQTLFPTNEGRVWGVCACTPTGEFRTGYTLNWVARYQLILV